MCWSHYTSNTVYMLFTRGLHLFKGLCLLFLPNVPGATFIQGGTFIPESRVHNSWELSTKDTVLVQKSVFT